MTAAQRKVLALALELPSDARRALAESLLDGLDDAEVPLGDGWQEEIARRIDAVERGEAQLISLEEAERRVLSRLDRTR